MASAEGSPARTDGSTASVFIGRIREREVMARAFESACQGRGRLLAVAGEAGIGKTSLVDAFLADHAATTGFRLAHGRCSERVAGTEAYLPWLEALDTMRRAGPSNGRAGAEPLAALIRRLAPTWHAQLTPLDKEHASDALIAASLRSASQERLKRELAALLEAAAREQPLVVVLEDLHWADVSTIDLLAFVGSRLATMAVLIVTTYRPSELTLAQSPFIAIRQDLQARGVASELRLDFLDQGDIEAYLEAEFPSHTLPSDFATMVRARTEGSPLFMVDLLRYLRDRGAIARIDDRWTLTDAVAAISRDLPESMRGMIERKLGQLAEADRGLLVAAAVQGYQFDSAVVAEVLGLDQSAVEERLETLDATFGLVRFAGELEHPNGTLSLAYRFVHILYQEALYTSLKPTRRVALSKATATALMRAHGDQIDRLAVQLAALHEAARDYAAAAECHLRAARNATRVFASHESVALARNGLRMAALLPPTPAKDRLELQLSLTLGWSLINVRGYAAVEVEQTYTRAASLAERAEGRADLYRALWGLAMCYLSRAEYGRVFALARADSGPGARVGAAAGAGDRALHAGHGVGVPRRPGGRAPALRRGHRAGRRAPRGQRSTGRPRSGHHLPGTDGPGAVAARLSRSGRGGQRGGVDAGDPQRAAAQHRLRAVGRHVPAPVPGRGGRRGRARRPHPGAGQGARPAAVPHLGWHRARLGPGRCRATPTASPRFGRTWPSTTASAARSPARTSSGCWPRRSAGTHASTRRWPW